MHTSVASHCLYRKALQNLAFGIPPMRNAVLFPFGDEICFNLRRKKTSQNCNTVKWLHISCIILQFVLRTYQCTVRFLAMLGHNKCRSTDARVAWGLSLPFLRCMLCMAEACQVYVVTESLDITSNLKVNLYPEKECDTCMKMQQWYRKKTTRIQTQMLPPLQLFTELRCVQFQARPWCSPHSFWFQVI